MLKNKKSLRVLIFITSILIASQTLGYYKSYGAEISPRNTGFDLDGNGKVDVFDLAKVALKYNLSNSSGDFDVLVDLNKDNFIDIYTTSVVAYHGHKTLIDYDCTKGALTRGLAMNLAPKLIRVNAVAPGLIWTPLIALPLNLKK